MNNIKDWILVHGFALLHCAVVIVCFFLGFPDALILTLLTMTMVVLICLKKTLSVQFTAITIILANVFGYILGTLIAKFISLFLAEDLVLHHSLATFITTEALGWGLILFINKQNPQRVKKEVLWKENIGWIIAAVAIVFMIRLAIDLILSWAKITPGTTTQTIAEVCAFCLVFLIFFALYMRNQAEMERIEEKFLQSQDNQPYKEKFIIHLNNRIVPVPVKDIAYCYAETKSSYIVTRSGLRHPLDESLDAIEGQLDPKRFFRISRSCIIASDAISSVSKMAGSRLDITLIEGIQNFSDLTVSRARVSSFLEWFEK